jgi:iron complex outermembrane receptor protein
VGATLVLIDGHRMAPYPMPDDGERDFVDISSIPFDAIDRIEVLKDGASAVYGSDAMAGVVNVILKKTFTGTQLSAEAGTSSNHDGNTVHVSGTTGWGDLGADGRNFYVALEYRHQSPILLSDRPYLARTDWTPYGGDNLTQGIFNSSTSLPGSVTGYVVDPNTLAPLAFFPGCSATAQANGQCAFSNPRLQIQPETRNANMLSRFTTKLPDAWQLSLEGSLFDAKATQVGVYNASAPFSSLGVTSFQFGPASPIPVPYNAQNFPFVITVPANYPGNTSGQAAALVYNFPDVGPQTQQTDTQTLRLVAELTGSFAGWDVQGALGYTHAETRLTSSNFISLSGLQNALNAGTYVIGQPNSAAVYSQIAPLAASTSTNLLEFVSLRGSRDLAQLPGGALGVGAGIDFTHRALDEQFPASFASGDQVSPIYSFASGKQNITAAYAEVLAPVVRALELEAAARADHYDTYGTSFTPKFGAKFMPIESLSLRGTYARGFRAPNPVEIGVSGSTSGVLNPIYDPVLCAGGNSAAAIDYTQCAIFPPALQLPAAHLKPEKSRSYTLGMIFEPSTAFNASVDYYQIRISDQIIAVGQLQQLYYNNPALYGATIVRGAPINGDPVGPITYTYYPFINANTTRTSGIDLDLRYRFDLEDAGKLTAQLQATRMFSYELTAAGITYQLAGTHGPSFVSGDTGTPKDRAQFTLTWDYGAFELSGTVNYISSFSVTDSSGGIATCDDALSSVFPNGASGSSLCNVGSFTEFNLAARYELDRHWSLRASIINLFDTNAPYDVQTFGSTGNGAPTGGAPYNPALHQDGAIGRFYTIGASYKF